jgi:chemotaxis-related protein WspD
MKRASQAQLAVPGSAGCWKQIGVQGDRSCPELVQHFHCKNCPVYAAAASALLDRELPAEERSRLTNELARVPPQRTEHASGFVFRLGREWLALPTATLQQVVELRTVRSLPHRRNGLVLGLVNVRGELLVCVALEQLLGIGHDPDASPEQARTPPRMLVLADRGRRLVARVDEVHGSHHFSSAQLERPPATLTKALTTYTASVLPWQGKSVGCLSSELLFRTLEQSLL